MAYRWLQVIPAVSDELADDVMYGTVPELAAKATWAERDIRDIYVSGPDHMIVKTARVLRERGAPNRLIHYDLAPENLKTGQGSSPAGTGRGTRRSAARRPRPPPCRNSAAPGLPAAPSGPA